MRFYFSLCSFTKQTKAKKKNTLNCIAYTYHTTHAIRNEWHIKIISRSFAFSNSIYFVELRITVWNYEHGWFHFRWQLKCVFRRRYRSLLVFTKRQRLVEVTKNSDGEIYSQKHCEHLEKWYDFSPLHVYMLNEYPIHSRDGSMKNCHLMAALSLLSTTYTNWSMLTITNNLHLCILELKRKITIISLNIFCLENSSLSENVLVL